MDFGAISRDFDRKSLRPRQFFEIFGREPHAIARAAARGRSAQLLGTSEGRKHAEHHEAAWISARSHAISNAKFCDRENFSKISVRNRVQSHPVQHADARHSCWGPLRVVSMLRTTKRHGFRRDLTRFRTQNFEFSIRNRARSSRNPCRLVVRSFRTTHRGP